MYILIRDWNIRTLIKFNKDGYQFITNISYKCLIYFDSINYCM